MNTIILVFAALFGACVGSFLNVCIFRLPRRCLRLWKPKLSFCPECRRTLAWWENVPILGYIALGGKCRTCRSPIPLRYFLVELGTACLFLYFAGRELTSEVRDAPLFVVHAVLGAAFIVCALTDWDHRWLPDEIQVPGFLLAPFVTALVPEVLGKHLISVPELAKSTGALLESALPWWGVSEVATTSVKHALDGVNVSVGFSAAFTSIVGAAAGAGLIWLIGWIGEAIAKKPAMGFGDVKLMAMIGGYTGWQGVLAAVLLGCIFGSIYGLTSKVKSGHATIFPRDLFYGKSDFPGEKMGQSASAYLLLRLFGAPRAPTGFGPLRKFFTSKTPLKLRLGGNLAARFATGDSYLPFGPFLIVGAFIYAFWPDAVLGAINRYSELMAHLVVRR